MAHETGHLAAGHLSRGEYGMKKAMIPMLLSMVAGVAAMIAGAGELGMAIMGVGQSYAMGQMAAFTRVQESTADQIGDLIALGKDLCLANPGLCAEIARSAAASAASAVSSKTTTVQPIENAKDKNKPQSAASRVVPQPDVLGALIEKVAAPAPKAVPEKMVAKVQR